MTNFTRFAFVFAIATLVSAGSMGSAQDSAKGQQPAKEGAIGPLADGSVTIGPNYTPATELKARQGVPKGAMKSFVLSMKDSKVYPFDAKNPAFKKAPNETRKVSVYVPSQYVPGTPAPFSVIQDASYINILPTILDNMISDKRLPVMLAVFVPNGGGSRSFEYDTVSGKYAEFIETDVLPRVEKECKVTLTKDPDGRATMGGSSGGVAAFTMAWFHPEWYHRVLSYSGTFVKLQSNAQVPHGAWEYHENLIPKAEKKPLRVWLHVSENDNGAKTDASGFHNWVIANKNMADVLKNKGYHYRYTYALNAGHTDAKVTNQTLPEALVWLWQDYPAIKK
jgi:iron(III)-enterobactin esterase